MKPANLEIYPVLRNTDRGFTLLEVLVSLVLLSIALVAIFELFSANSRGLSKSDDYSHAVIVAESRMREILADDNLTEGAWEAATEDGYRINAVMSGTANDRTEGLKVRLLEISLTVSWTKDSRERTFNLRTLKMVNKQL
ncbi:MAG: prepilin-type N-terminal cleavage/methylation domain-containing protein [Nitrospirae bacterium]|nr:prepilin-type N-terminal cleavage/methylation domain-containing protein [Nitrospirota bacterium]